MNLFVLAEYWQDYDIINHMNEDCVQTIYFHPPKYIVLKICNWEGDSLLYKDLVTSAINEVYQIVRNGFSIVGGLTAKRFSCSRQIVYKGDITCQQSSFLFQNIL